MDHYVERVVLTVINVWTDFVGPASLKMFNSKTYIVLILKCLVVRAHVRFTALTKNNLLR